MCGTAPGVGTLLDEGRFRGPGITRTWVETLGRPGLTGTRRNPSTQCSSAYSTDSRRAWSVQWVQKSQSSACGRSGKEDGDWEGADLDE